MNVTRHAAVVKHDEDATYHKSGQPCVGKITIELTKDQAYRIVELLTKRDVNQETYAFNWRIVEKVNKALNNTKN